jgi:methyl-accepting chemotaxis protein
MTRGTRAFLNFMFFIAALGGSALIIYSRMLEPEVANFGPTSVVVIFALMVAIAQKAGADGELSEHYADSIYFLGFLFTLVSLATLFYRMGEGGLGSSLAGAVGASGDAEEMSLTLLESQRFALSTKMIEETFSLIGIAVTTSVAGVLMRNLVRSWFLKDHSGGNGDMEAAVSEHRKISEGMSGGFSDTMGAIGSYFEERKDLAGQMKKKEKAYVNGLENFTETIDRFSSRLSEVEKKLLESSESLGNNLKRQAEGIGSTDESLRSLSAGLQSLKADAEAINLKKTVDELATFGRETGELNAVLDSLIDIVERKVDTMQKAG